jgi:hypothetical protein
VRRRWCRVTLDSIVGCHLGNYKQRERLMETSNLPRIPLLHDAAMFSCGDATDEQCMKAPRPKAGGNCTIELRDWVVEMLEYARGWNEVGSCARFGTSFESHSGPQRHVNAAARIHVSRLDGSSSPTSIPRMPRMPRAEDTAEGKIYLAPFCLGGFKCLA